MPLPSTRSWIRVLALVTVIVALTGGSSFYRPPRYECLHHAIEVRQTIAPPSVVALREHSAYHVKSQAVEDRSDRTSQRSQFTQTYRHLLKTKAQPPPYASASPYRDFQLWALAWSTQQTLVRKARSLRPIADPRAPQSLHVQQRYSRPPPSLT